MRPTGGPGAWMGGAPSPKGEGADVEGGAPVPLARLGELLEDGAAFPHLFGPRVPPGLARSLLEAPITRETAALLDHFLEGRSIPSGPPTGGQGPLSPPSGRA